MKIYFNGKYVPDQEAKFEYNDRGILLSDGIFDTMRAYHGKIFCLEDHYDRFKKSADFLGIPFTLTLKYFQNVLINLLKENDLIQKDASLRITLTRGAGPRGLLPPENMNPSLMATAFPIITTIDKPLKVTVSHVRRNEFSPISNIKSLCYLDNILARMDALKKGFDECILLNTAKNLACASVANIFIVTEVGIFTPKVEDGILPGVTRKKIIEICRKNNISIFEKSITQEELIQAKEVFFTNSLIEIQPVIQIDSKLINDSNVNVGEIVFLLQKLYKNEITMM